MNDSTKVLVLGITSILCLGPLTGIPGIILARRVKEPDGAATVGLVLCWLGFVVFLLGMVAGLLLPLFRK